MRIISLELKGYRRFPLARHKTLHYHPKKRLQLLVGTNGSGKSSLLKELSPLPAISAEYDPGGYKRIEIEHQGKHYALTSRFDGAAKHSFCCDGVELNPGGTLGVQKELVAQHFLITPELHELMSGVVTFSSMSVAQRRQWFTQLSRINFEYAFEVYQKRVTVFRELDAQLKRVRAQHASECQKVLDEAAYRALSEEIAELKKLLYALIDLKARVETPAVSFNEEHLRTLNEALGHALNTVKTQPHPLSGAALEEKTQALYVTLKTLSQQYQDSLKQLESQQNLYERFKHLGVSAQEEINAKREALQVKLAQLKSHLTLVPLEPVEQVSWSIQTAYDELFPVLKGVKSVRNEEARIRSLKDTLRSLEETRSALRSKLLQCQAELKHFAHLKSQEATTCPQCAHRWIIGYDAKKEADVIAQCNELSAQDKTLTQTIEAHKEALAECEKTQERWVMASHSIARYSLLMTLWSQVHKEELLEKDPEMVLALLEQARAQLSALAAYHDTQALCVELDALSRVHQSQDRTNLSALEAHLALQQQRVATLLSEGNRLKAQYQELLSYREVLNTLQARYDALEAALQEQEVRYKQALNHLRYQHYVTLIDALHQQLNALELRLTQAQQQKDRVAMLAQELDTLTNAYEVERAIVQELSPKDGLIARSMSGFINDFIERMNAIIRSIWLYPFSLVPILLEDDERLDYRFEVEVNEHFRISDVQRCSSGMREIIDLAFRVVAMHYLGLMHYPLYADEFGRAMDATHRVRAFELLTKTLTQYDYSQIFIISHHEHLYANLKMMDVCVLDDRALNGAYTPDTSVFAFYD